MLSLVFLPTREKEKEKIFKKKKGAADQQLRIYM